MFNHSSEPICLYSYFGGCILVLTRMEVKSGSELTVRYHPGRCCLHELESLSIAPGSGSMSKGPCDRNTVHLTSIHYRVSGNQNFCFAPTETIDGRVKKIRSPTCGMVWWLVFAEIYLVVDYLGLIHVLRNLDLTLLMVSCARWSGVSAHKGSTKWGRVHTALKFT